MSQRAREANVKTLIRLVVDSAILGALLLKRTCLLLFGQGDDAPATVKIGNEQPDIRR